MRMRNEGGKSMDRIRFLDLVVFIFLALLCGFILFSIVDCVINQNIELFSISSPLVFALLVGILLVIFLIITIYQDLKSDKKVEENREESSKELLYDIKIAVIFTIGVLLYTLLLKHIGFMIASIIFMLISMAVLNTDDASMWKKLIKGSIVSVIIVPVLYFIFHELFNVMLP